jgi:hypothetical protein
MCERHHQTHLERARGQAVQKYFPTITSMCTYNVGGFWWVLVSYSSTSVFSDIFQCAISMCLIRWLHLSQHPERKALNKQRVLIAGSTIVSFLPFSLSSLELTNLFSRLSITGLKCAYQDPKGSQYLDYKRNSLGGYLPLQFAK